MALVPEKQAQRNLIFVFQQSLYLSDFIYGSANCKRHFPLRREIRNDMNLNICPVQVLER
jgi:hypothetical protein